MTRRNLTIDDEENTKRVTFPPAAPESEETPATPPIQVITMNGFMILKSEGVQRSDERRFVVKSPSGQEHDVLVQIDPEAVAYVERMTRRNLPAANSFWTSHAEHILAEYLWKEGKVPSTRRLIITDIDRDDLPMVARWQANSG